MSDQSPRDASVGRIVVGVDGSQGAAAVLQTAVETALGPDAASIDQQAVCDVTARAGWLSEMFDVD